ncbi:MAG: sulfatase-like hydrolase/transferase [Lentisphaeria bacterium]|nr:sulfatase-like hydrolase/transferase [Lentisphaeria bacterium]
MNQKVSQVQFRLLTAYLLTSLLSFSSYSSDRPNIVLIMADDLGYECIGAYGGTSYRTPTIDQLAQNGILFKNAHSQPICTPSRVQIMTGKYNVRNYIGFAHLDTSEKTFANYFQDAGYQTCIIGKWQLGGGARTIKDFGFEHYALWRIGNSQNKSRYPTPAFLIDGQIKDFQNGEYGPDVLSKYAKEFILNNKEKPFFLYYPMLLVHNPFEPTPDSKDWNPKAKGLDNEKGGFKGKDDIKYFLDMMSNMDLQVKKLIGYLKEADVLENTLVIFTGDNGTTRNIVSIVNGKEIHGGKGYTTDAGTHVPLIAYWQRNIPKGQVSEDLVDFSDILPTLTAAAKISIPNEETKELDGKSFLPQLKGKIGTPREWIYCWSPNRLNIQNVKQFVRNKQYKLYASGKFYDLESDIYEKSPIIASKLSNEQKQLKSKFSEVLAYYKSKRTHDINSKVKALEDKRQKRQQKKSKKPMK